MSTILKENLKIAAAVISGLSGFYLGWHHAEQITMWLRMVVTR